MTRRIRTYAELSGSDRSGLARQLSAQQRRVDRRLRTVSRIVAVTSGKGGVGKSLISAALGAALQLDGQRVGLLDADLQGPTAARLSGVEPRPLVVTEDDAEPVRARTGVLVMSMELLLREGAPLTWHGPDADSFVWHAAEERRALREFLADVAWGELDWLIVDLPPGTQRMIDLLELCARTVVVAVTIPSDAARASAGRALHLAREREARLIGVVENMVGYACESCETVRPLFPGAAGRSLADAHGVPLLGRVPFDPAAARLADAGDLEALLRTTTAGRNVVSLAERLNQEVGPV